jgi:transposase
MVIQKPPTLEVHLCADAGYKRQAVKKEITDHGYTAHVQGRAQEKKQMQQTKCPARRWVVERTNSWFNRFRKLLVSFEKSEQSYLALQVLAAALMCWRTTVAIHG